jgi:ligand-binding sensor domain-containing protein/signal transduction histidine kinase
MKPNIHILVIVLLHFCLIPLFSQISDRFHRIGVEQGLAQSTVWKIAQDPYGFIWFATPDGLNRYDGHEMKTYRNDLSDTLAPLDNYFNAFLWDSRGIFWLATSQGLAQFDYEKEKIVHGHNGVHFLRFTVAADAISTIVEDARGSLWVATVGSGIVQFDPRTGSTKHYKHQPGNERTVPSNSIHTLLAADSVTWYIGTSRGLVQMNKESGECYIPRNTSAVLRTGSIKDLKKDHDGNLWIATERNGLFRYDPTSGSHTQFLTKLSDDNITALLIDKRGFVWAGTQNGLDRLNPPDGKITRFSHDAGNPTSIGSNRIMSLFEDASENLWVGTVDNGVNKLDLKRSKFNVIRNMPGEKPILRQPVVWRVLEDRKGDLWIAANELHRYNRASGKSESFPDIGRVQTLAMDAQGNIWVSSRKGLMEMDRNGSIIRSFQDRHVGVQATASLLSYALHVDADGIFWIGSQNGHLIRFDTRREQFIELSPDGEPPDLTLSRLITGIAENDHGDLYIARSNSFFRYSKKLNQFTRFPPENSQNDTIRFQGALSVCMSRSNVLWIGTTRGLYSYSELTGQWRRFTDEEGLINDKVWAILEDHHGAIWFSTNKGIIRLTETPDGKVTIRNYDGSDIPTTPEFNLGAAFRSARTGEMFFGSVNGLVVFHPDSMQDNPYPPRVVLTAFRKFDQDAGLNGSMLRMKELTLPYSDNVFSIRFVALEFTNPGKNQYAYKMEGFEEHWTYPRVRREVRYTNLPAGEYTFRVKASNNDGVWNEEGVALRIVIVPPFWTTWWFLGSVGMVLLGIVGGSIRYVELRKIRRQLERLENERAVDRERARISRDMHDELGANLTSLSMITEIARRSLADPGRADEQLQKAASIASHTVRKLDEIVWAVNPKADRLDNLAAYISEYAQEFFSTTEIRLRFDFPEQIPEVPLPSDVRHNVFLVVKEALTNIAKHSAATEANISIIVRDNHVTIELHDNGKGFEMAASHLGNGIKNMRQRIQSVGGLLDLQSGRSGGTVVSIRIPLRTGISSVE